jgi:hypothetical protein
MIKNKLSGIGLGCYTSDATMAEYLGWNRDTVRKYKRLAIEVGWFTPNGKRHGRAIELDISRPYPRQAVEAVEPGGSRTGAAIRC